MYPFVAFHFYICNEMSYIPDIIDYKPFYIQTDADEMAIDTTHWGMVARVNPFPILPTPKEVYRNEWLDEDGDDEYNAQMHYEAFEFEVQFHIITIGASAVQDLISQVEDFFVKIMHGEFKVYDSYTAIGRRKVRYAGGHGENFRERVRKGVGKASCDLTITFKANDPITRVTLVDGKLVEA